MQQRNMQCRKIAQYNTKWCNTQKIKWIPHREYIFARRTPYFKWLVKVGFGEPDYIRMGNESNCCFFSPGQVGLACGTGVLVPSFFGSSTGPRQVLYHQLNSLLEFAELYENKFSLDLIGINPLWYQTLQYIGWSSSPWWQSYSLTPLCNHSLE